MGGGPCWFTYEKGFSNCGEYWWSVFTFTINFFPEYVIANEGCYYWGWYPACDLQLFIFLPWFIYFTIKSGRVWLQILIVCFGVCCSAGLNFWIIWANNMAAGLFAPQDIFIFKIFVIKPYSKFYTLFLGIGMGLMMNSIAQYRQTGSKSGIWHSLEKSWVFGIVSWIVSLLVLGFIVFYPLGANKDPMKWSRFHNSIFVSLSRPAFIMAIMMLIICMLLNHGRIMKRALGSSVLTPFSRLSYGVYLIFPLVTASLISAMNQSLFLSYSVMFYLVGYSYVFSFFVAMISWFVLE